MKNLAVLFMFCAGVSVSPVCGAGFNVISIGASTQRFAWTENAGWITAPTNGHGLEVVVVDGGSAFLQGYLWADNVGWISFGNTNGSAGQNNTSEDFGVILDASWNLGGFAWSEHAGWINFDVDPGCRIHPQRGELIGYAWSESLGWIRWGENSTTTGLPYGIVLDVPLLAEGVPTWWAQVNGFTNETGDLDFTAADDADGDGITNADEFYAGTDPDDATSFWGFNDIVAQNDGQIILFFDSLNYRFYNVLAFTSGGNNVDEAVTKATREGTGEQLEVILNSVENIEFYGIKAGLDPLRP